MNRRRERKSNPMNMNRVRSPAPVKRRAWLVVYSLGLCAILCQQASLLFPLTSTVESFDEKILISPSNEHHASDPSDTFIPWNFTKDVSERISFPHTYWINLDVSTDRRDAMLNLFAKRNHSQLQTRVPAVDVEEMRKMLWNHNNNNNKNVSSIVFHGSTFHDGNRDIDRRLYSLKEGACTTSHLQSIHEAYIRGHDVAIFTEDDSFLGDEFVANWTKHISQAPADWQVLQLVTINPSIVRQHVHLKDPWVTWFPDMWSTATFLINRRGMKAIISKTLLSYDEHTGHRQWRIPEFGLVLADELIYHLAQPTYTTTFPFTSIMDFRSTVQEITRRIILYRENFTQPKWLTTLEESILVYTGLQVFSIEEFRHEWKGIQNDFHALCTRIHTRSCYWAVHVSVGVKSGAENNDNEEPLVDSIRNLTQFINGGKQPRPANLDITVEDISKQEAPYNRMMGLFKHHFLKLREYDYILFKDSERRIAGFPWLTFVERKGQAMVSGALQENRESSYFRGKQDRLTSSWYNYLQGLHFRTKAAQTKELFMDVTPLEVPIVEYGFTLLNGSFAYWFFLTQSSFFQDQQDWEVELMWCEAARDFLSSNIVSPACVMVPLVSMQDFYLPKPGIVREAPEKKLKVDDDNGGGGGILGYFKTWYESLFPKPPLAKPISLMNSKVMDRWREASREWKSLTETRQVKYVIENCCNVQHCGNEQLCQTWKEQGANVNPAYYQLEKTLMRLFAG